MSMEAEGTARAGGDQDCPARLRLGRPRNHVHRGLQDQSECNCVWVMGARVGVAGKLGSGNKKKRDNPPPHPHLTSHRQGTGL